MNISRIHLFRDQSKNDQSLFIQKNSYMNKLDYIKKWQKDIQYFDKTIQLKETEMNKNSRFARKDNSQELNQSFYSLYFSPENLQKHKQLPEDSLCC